MKSGSPSRTTAAHKTQTKIQAWSSLVFHCCHSSFYSFRSSSVGHETGEWRRCRSLSFTPPASLRSHGSWPRPTRHTYIIQLLVIMGKCHIHKMKWSGGKPNFFYFINEFKQYCITVYQCKKRKLSGLLALSANLK